MEGGLLLNAVVAEGARALELLAGVDETLLLGRDALAVLDLLLHVGDGVGRLDVQRDRLAREVLDEDLHDDRSRVVVLEVGCSCYLDD